MGFRFMRLFISAGAAVADFIIGQHYQLISREYAGSETHGHILSCNRMLKQIKISSREGAGFVSTGGRHTSCGRSTSFHIGIETWPHQVS
jgi:hypothetical protein